MFSKRHFVPGEPPLEVPEKEMTIRLSGMSEGRYPIVEEFEMSKIEEDYNFSWVGITAGSVSHVPETQAYRTKLRVIDGFVDLLKDVPGQGYRYDGKEKLLAAFTLRVNPTAFSPTICEVEVDKETNLGSVRCTCANAKNEKKPCALEFTEGSVTGNQEKRCCYALPFDESATETVRFEVQAPFVEDLCEGIGLGLVAKYCYGPREEIGSAEWPLGNN